MTRSQIVWSIVLGVGIGLVAVRSLQTGQLVGTAFTRVDEVIEAPDGRQWELKLEVPRTARGDEGVSPDVPRTIGVWLAALLTLAVLSFLYADNAFYKLAESLVVGVSAGYTMVVAFWEVLVPDLAGRLVPRLVQATVSPQLDREVNWLYLVPLVMGLMLLMRLAPAGNWLARWPLAFIIGLMAGLRLVHYFQADFLSQIQATVLPLADYGDQGLQVGQSLRHTILAVSVAAGLIYFLFSVEHRGPVRYAAQTGIWVLMITFGASFAYTVMGRITLLTQRVVFLLRDWLWLVD